MTEKFEPQEYRDQLSVDLKSVENHRERREMLDSEQNSKRYEIAKEAHLDDIQDLFSWMESGEREEVILKHFFVGALGEDLARAYESGKIECLDLYCLQDNNKGLYNEEVRRLKSMKDKWEKFYSKKANFHILSGLRFRQMAKSWKKNVEPYLKGDVKNYKKAPNYAQHFIQAMYMDDDQMFTGEAHIDEQIILGIIKANLK